MNLSVLSVSVTQALVNLDLAVCSSVCMLWIKTKIQPLSTS